MSECSRKIIEGRNGLEQVMLFNSLEYFIFLPIVVIGYYIVPHKLRYMWLLVASYYFYMRWNPSYILLLLGCTVVTYFSARILEKKSKASIVMWLCVILLLLILGYFKYFDFLIGLANTILQAIRLEPIRTRFELLLPVGISFYVLQSLGYVLDVYRGEVKAERNFLRYALFVSFFPQLVAGPIERSGNLLGQLDGRTSMDWDKFRRALFLILYGLFCKMVIADRIAIIVKTVYGQPGYWGGVYILVAAFLFSFQIYCDFYGYSTIARGSALLLGISLTDNFCAPYYSRSIKEFWRRWHISLSTWFRDYLYIPFGGNRRGTIRTKINLLLVLSVSGLWHGAAFSYVIWGFLNGLYQVVGDMFSRLRTRENRFSTELFRIIRTFALITFTWIFFAAGSMTNAITVFKYLFSVHLSNWHVVLNGGLYLLGVSREYFGILILAIIVLLIVDYFKYKGFDVVACVLSQGWWFRILCLFSLVFSLILFGCYGEIYDTQQFIYFQF